MKDHDNFFLANKDLWNKRTAVHKDSSFYDVRGFKAGKNVLTSIELHEVRDVSGKKMLHLQCHFGMDSLNWARLGADVTGIDLSDRAINEARKLNDELGMNAKFICCNIYDLHPHNIESSKISPEGGDLEAPGTFDIVFTSYGVIGWLPDLDKWAEIISYYLKPGGIFYMAEFHPVIWMFDDDFKEIKYCYENRGVIETDSQGTYTDRDADIQAKEYGWNHSISEVLNALITHGLSIDLFNEHMYSPYPCFNNMVQNKEGNWWIKGLEDKIPMVYSVNAKKKG
jgi:SAM-dependent methyltransferase